MEAVSQTSSNVEATTQPSRSEYQAKGVFLDQNNHLKFAPDDADDPKNWTFARKCYLTGVAILLVMNATFASSAPTGTFNSIAKHFNVSLEATGLVTTLFLLGYCAGPLFWAPFSEFYGRRWIFYLSFTLYLAFNFLCAFAPNFASLLLGRFLTGTSASSALSNSPGLIADIWDVTKRGKVMILFTMATFIGPALGPVIAGFLELKKTWNWTFYVLLWLAGITEALLLTVPETLPSIVLLNKARRLRKADGVGSQNIVAPVEASDRTLASIFKKALIRPWQILFDPISFLVAIYYSVVYTLLYMLFTIYPIVFQQKRGWNAGVGQLPLLGVVIGGLSGGALVWLFDTSVQKKRATSHKSAPEDCLPAAMVGGVLFAITMFWFAWTAEYNSIHWIVPTVAGTFLAASILIVFWAFVNYIVDCYLIFAASALAANTVSRSVCASASPLFTQYMFDSMGVGGGGSLIAGIAVLLAPIPFVFWKYGKSIRQLSKYAQKDEDIHESKPANPV